MSVLAAVELEAAEFLLGLPGRLFSRSALGSCSGCVAFDLNVSYAVNQHLDVTLYPHRLTPRPAAMALPMLPMLVKENGADDQSSND